jgi:hypothetical protein
MAGALPTCHATCTAPMAAPEPYIEEFELDAGGWEGRNVALQRVPGSTPGSSAVRSASPCECDRRRWPALSATA